jgi:hypothetical protein
MANSKYNINLTIKKKASLGAFFLFFFAIQGFGQTFSKRFNYKVYSQCENVVNTDYGYLFSGNLGDTTDSGLFQLSLLYGGVDFNGDSLFSKHYESDQWRTVSYFDNNVVIHDSILVTATNFYVTNSDTNFTCLIWTNLLGDTIKTRKYYSPYYYSSNNPSNQTNLMQARSLIASDDGEFLYLVCHVFDYPPAANSYIVKKITNTGDEIWTYLPPIDPNYPSCDQIEFFDNNIWLIVPSYSGISTFNKLVKLNDQTGEMIQEIELIPEGQSPIKAPDMVMTNTGVIVNSVLASTGMNSIPCIYKMDFSGNEIWRNQPSNEYSPLQENDHITQAPDGGFVCCSVRYESTPATTAIPTTNEYYRLWLWKVDANGELLWERKYAYITLEEDTNFLIYNYPHDMKTTPDGGYILAGEATVLCTNYPTCSEFTQQGWLLKVDGCGCLVPGCDENCTTTTDDKTTPQVLFKLGPNPATDYINLYLGEINATQKILMQILSTDGKTIRNMPLTHGDTTYVIDTTTLAQGNYILAVFDGNNLLQSEKLVVR